MKTKPISFLIAAAMLVGTTMLAQEAVTRHFGFGLPAFLAVYDQDGDSQLSQEEQADMEESRNGLPQARVIEFDTDQNGVLSPEEAAQARSELDNHVLTVRSEHFNVADLNSDNILTFDEFVTIPSVWELFMTDSVGVFSAFANMQDPLGLVTLNSFLETINGSNTEYPETDFVVEYPDLEDLLGDEWSLNLFPTNLFPDISGFIPDSIFALPDIEDLTVFPLKPVLR